MIELKATGVTQTHLCAVGSVDDVINGRVQPALKKKTFHANDYYCGFELASPHSIESMGESVLVNGFCYTTSTDHHDHYLKTIFGETFYTSGMFLVPRDAKASYQLVPHKDVFIGYQEFCEHIHTTAKKPCLVAALVRFKNVEGACIEKAPIDNENIFEHKEKYYSDVKLQFNDQYAFIVAAIANFKTDPQSITDQLNVVLYQNPFDVKDVLNTHTHGILLSKAVNTIDEITPDKVTHTVHIYTENTVISEVLWGDVFVVGNIICQ